METILENVLNFLREQYPEGTRIQIRELSGEGREPAPDGIGVLESIDETGAFHVLWPDGGELDLKLGEDKFDILAPELISISLIDSKWKSCILDELRHRSMRPSELHKALPEATPRVLDIQLKELVDDGLVIKTIYPELPPHSEYSISELGMSLIPIIDSMLAWGEQHMEVFEKKYKA